MGRDGHLGLDGVVAVVEAEAADDGDLFDGDGGEELGDGHGSGGDGAVEDGAGDEVGGDFLLVVGCEAEVWGDFGVDLAEVNLAIFLGDEADEVGPVGGHGGRWWSELVLLCPLLLSIYIYIYN